MALARAQLADASLTRCYRCVTRCVRRVLLLRHGDHDRNEWLENRLKVLSGILAEALGGFMVMENRLHVGTRPTPVDSAPTKLKRGAQLLHLLGVAPVSNRKRAAARLIPSFLFVSI
jgi:hypothetical protein